MLPVGLTKAFVKFQSMMVRPKSGPQKAIITTAQQLGEQTCNFKRFNIFCCAACRLELLSSLRTCLKLEEVRKLGLQILSRTFKEKSVVLAGIWAKQVEYIMAQRLRRGQQIISLYSQMWEAKAAELVIKSFSRRSKNALLATCLAAVFDWEKEKIPDEVLLRHQSELEFVNKLKSTTVTCEKCGHRLLIDLKLPHVEYCRCIKNTASSKAVLEDWESTLSSDEEWIPFIEREDFIVWKQEHKEHKGLFAYKVYGVYSDVAARDFLAVQLDNNYRKEWDATAIQLDVIDSDPKSGSDVLYWEAAWPRFFSNRDYVFKRRALVDELNGDIVIRAESTAHPKCPLQKNCHRVDEYWSYWVIKPTQGDMDKPGVEFSLTYFDNPGLSIPSAFVSWVAMSALPDYLTKLRRAAVVLMEKRFEEEKRLRQEEEEQKRREEEIVVPADVKEETSLKSFLPFSLTLPDVEEPMEPLYHHQFYYL
ncbi:stAR-related lipid transfer protein 7, mitochondrial [Neocloeon triangulifer]|uniref:stAR-related lipid transfer protein 7, mitochondrial n=1 Tax=Neocloeon triangulifer TaxID=2078957 RepID=UPI00286F46E2|nr:stAR-related lipid transfer protein 7, mitochondrial [Neocloeon triangulifer]